MSLGSRPWLAAGKAALSPLRLEQVRPRLASGCSSSLPLVTLCDTDLLVTQASCVPSVTAPEQVGMVSSLKILSSRSNVVRVTWVGVPGATAYKVVWSRRDGNVPSQVNTLPVVPTSPDLCPALSWLCWELQESHGCPGLQIPSRHSSCALRTEGLCLQPWSLFSLPLSDWHKPWSWAS